MVGNKDAPITIVKYANFNCQYCAEGAASMEVIRRSYGGRVKIYFMHMVDDPVAAHVARYYEAIARHNPSKARKFHDLVYENLLQLQSNIVKLRTIVDQAGADHGQVEKIMGIKEINNVIKADTQEAIAHSNSRGRPVLSSMG